jgi:hypothetical protein
VDSQLKHPSRQFDLHLSTPSIGVLDRTDILVNLAWDKILNPMCVLQYEVGQPVTQLLSKLWRINVRFQTTATEAVEQTRSVGFDLLINKTTTGTDSTQPRISSEYFGFGN